MRLFILIREIKMKRSKVDLMKPSPDNIELVNDDNRFTVQNYWGGQEIIIGFSRRDEGLIAIGKPDYKNGFPNGISWLHLCADDLQILLNEADRYWQSNKKKYPIGVKE